MAAGDFTPRGGGMGLPHVRPGAPFGSFMDDQQHDVALQEQVKTEVSGLQLASVAVKQRGRLLHVRTNDATLHACIYLYGSKFAFATDHFNAEMRVDIVQYTCSTAYVLHNYNGRLVG